MGGEYGLFNNYGEKIGEIRSVDNSGCEAVGCVILLLAVILIAAPMVMWVPFVQVFFLDYEPGRIIAGVVMLAAMLISQRKFGGRLKAQEGKEFWSIWFRLWIRTAVVTAVSGMAALVITSLFDDSLLDLTAVAVIFAIPISIVPCAITAWRMTKADQSVN